MLIRILILNALLLSEVFLLAGDTPIKGGGRVVLVEKPGIAVEFEIPAEEARALFRQGLLKLTGATDVKSAWRSLNIQNGDVVGIKISTQGGTIMSTRRPLVNEIAEGVLAAGAAKVIIWDKSQEEMVHSGYNLKEIGNIQVKAVIPTSGYDGGQFYVNEILGRLIWGDYLFKKTLTKEGLLEAAAVDKKKKPDSTPLEEQTSNKSYFARVLVQECTKIVNVPVLTDHEVLGVYGCLASLAVGSVDNTRRFLAGDQQGDPAIGEILDRDLFRKKVILHVMDGLLGQFAGGPAFAPQYTRNWGAIYLGHDPVAIDTLAVQRIQNGRRDTKVVLFEKTPKHITGAGELGLGESDPKKIQVIRVGP